MGILLLITAMVCSPTALGMMLGGQAVEENKQNTPSTSVTAELYVCSTGEIKQLELEEYVCCVLLAEVPYSYEYEALRAMAVAVRTYCLRRIEGENDYTKHFSADLCDDYTHCLGYVSLDEAKIRWGEDNADEYYAAVKKAVDSTVGEVLYYDSELIDAVFHSNSYNYTESAKNIWGYDVPYLTSVTTYENAEISKKVYSKDELIVMLENAGISVNKDIGPDEMIEGVTKNKSGRVENIALCGKSITGRRTREIFGTRSTCFDLEFDGEYFVFTSRGSGHGVGLSQFGCEQMAEEGADYKEILSHYYTGITFGFY